MPSERKPSERKPSEHPRPHAVAVYCGTNRGTDPAYAEAAASLGRLLAEGGIRLVYGGGRRGLMGVLADAVLGDGGEVLGVITRALVEKEVMHLGLTELTVVETMHERKKAMVDAADAFIMLPGGFGTLDEFFEVLTWTQLGVHVKPCGILDVAGYFAPLRTMLDTAAREGFVTPAHREMVIIESEPGSLLRRLITWTPATASKWVDS